MELLLGAAITLGILGMVFGMGLAIASDKLQSRLIRVLIVLMKSCQVQIAAHVVSPAVVDLHRP